jgi:hypothetical protein
VYVVVLWIEGIMKTAASQAEVRSRNFPIEVILVSGTLNALVSAEYSWSLDNGSD